MKRRILLALLLAAAASFNAAAQRISLEVPLSPKPAVTPAFSVSPLAQTFPAALSLWSPGPDAPSALPVGAVPVPAAVSAVKVAAAVPALPAAVVPARVSVPARASRPSGPKVIDSLRLHGAESAGLSELKGEAGAGALERNFMSAASLGDDPIVPAPGSEPNLPGTPESKPLLARMLERVRLDDRGRPDEKKALEESFKRMLETPTGRRYAEEFLAEGLTAHVHFEDFPDSQLYLMDGRKKFTAAQAYTDWKPEGYAEVRLNRHYVDGDPEFMRDSLPSIIGHELLGHGLWYGRANKDNLHIPFHYHELNETIARLVGWAIDHELDGRFEEAGAWNYLADPAHYLSNLKMRLPYYAVTFGQGEMADPMATLKSRLESAKLELERARRDLAAQKTWLPVLDHFSRDHGIPSQRFDLLRLELADQVAQRESEVVNVESIVREVGALIERMEAEPGHDSENYLRQAAAHPFFERLSADTARLGAELTKRVNETPFVPPLPAPPRPADQISWEELAVMYREDVAADEKRAVKHWR